MYNTYKPFVLLNNIEILLIKISLLLNIYEEEKHIPKFQIIIIFNIFQRLSPKWILR